MLDYISEQKVATIKGVAGTGKTIVAKKAAKIFSEERRKVLFLCFNKFLFAHLAKQYPYENVAYYNIHEYSDIKMDFSKPEDRVEALYSIDYEAFDFDDIVIDEDGNLDVQLETWLLSLGKQEQISVWKSRLS